MLHLVDALDDPRVALYRNLKDRELAAVGRRFVAEGDLIVRRLLASEFPVESVLASHRKAEAVASLASHDTPVYVADDALLASIAGFKLHTGVLAVGRRLPPPPLEELLPVDGKRATLVVCPDLISPANLGSIVRVAAAFGVDGLILGERCCDPFWRQSIRVSMGAVFRLPIRRSQDLSGDLRALRERFGFELCASVLDESAQPLAAAGRGDRFALLLGEEAHGLDAETIALCDRRVTIPMRRDVDSLNVAVAAGICLHHFCDR